MAAPPNLVLQLVLSRPTGQQHPHPPRALTDAPPSCLARREHAKRPKTLAYLQIQPCWAENLDVHRNLNLTNPRQILPSPQFSSWWFHPPEKHPRVPGQESVRPVSSLRNLNPFLHLLKEQCLLRIQQLDLQIHRIWQGGIISWPIGSVIIYGAHQSPKARLEWAAVMSRCRIPQPLVLVTVDLVGAF